MMISTSFCSVLIVGVACLFNPRIIDEIGHGIGGVRAD